MSTEEFEAPRSRSPLDYNKIWALLLALGLLYLVDLLGYDLHVIIEAAALIFAVERTPNGRVPLRSEDR